MVVTFDQALEKIRKETDDETEKGSSVHKTQRGNKFERLMLHYFKNDSIYKNEFKDVKLWYDWFHEQDTGIDLVAEQYDGKLVGIQCKCWNDDSSIALNDISNMFAVKESKKMDRLILVFTGKDVSKHIEQQGGGAFSIIMKSDLRSSAFDWGKKRMISKPKKLRPHQKEAVDKVVTGLKDADRGTLTMACGTGKTITSLHIAENIAGKNGLILYLVPSLSLIPQVMREWAENGSITHQYMAVCSDRSAGSDEQGSITEIPIQPSTDVDTILEQLQSMRNGMRVIFSTYNSVERVGKAIRGMNEIFDLILFDEAHRTTGAEKIKESYYLTAHKDSEVPARKRLYMTATPRVYSGKGNNDATTQGLEVYSMDDVEKYGEVLYDLPFSKAVDIGLLTHFKIIMPEVNEDDAYGEIIKAARDQGGDAKDYEDLELDYMTKVYSICKAITYDDDKFHPLQRVMIFHNTIKKSRLFSGHGRNMDKAKKQLKLDKTTQKILSFDNLSERLLKTDSNLAGYKTVTRHVDGSTNSLSRGERIDWLRNSSPKEIRILSNARCLQEGVDIPALDAVIFMEPKNSPIDIIQSIGRVMRKSDGKESGYVIVPIPVLKGDDPHHVLKMNKRYKQISEILRAILSHDDGLRRLLNMYVLAKSGKGGDHVSPDPGEIPPRLRDWIASTLGKGLSDKLLKDVQNVLLSLGDPSYHSNMGERLGEQAVIIETKLNQRVKIEPETAPIIKVLHENLKPIVGHTLTMEQTIRALSQHAVMSRVFNVMFPRNDNPVASAFDDTIERLNIQESLKKFEAFYAGIQADIERFEEPDAKQDFLRAIYDSFFRGSDRKAADKHGIVHTPVEIVNFILESVRHVLESEFGKTFNDRMVKVLDPFTGTGIFIAQLIERGMIDALRDKYQNDIYANEVMLPAFYVAMSNIEASYQKMTGEYTPFQGISYMDTFAQHPSYRLDSEFRQKQTRITDDNLEEAMERVKRQNMDYVNVIVGNPPYSGGQETASEDNKNDSHPALETRIKNTYTSKARNVGFKGAILNPNNSYIKAIRWASDRIGESGVIGIITPSGFITGNSEAGIRACLEMEFTDVYCFDLLGEKGRTGHGRNIFEYKGESTGGTTVGTAITILVKNQDKQGCTIRYSKLQESDYSGEDKRKRVKELGSIAGMEWEIITPDRFHDWLEQRGDTSERWDSITPMGSKEGKRGKTNDVMFGMYSRGVITSRDDWVYNASPQDLEENMRRTIEYCSKQDLDHFDTNEKDVAWTPIMEKKIRDNGNPEFNRSNIRISLYRPFIKQYLYLDSTFVEHEYHIPSFYPHPDSKNNSIMVPDKIKGEFSTIITDITPDLHIHEASQCFPMRAKKQKDKNRHVVGSQSASQPVSQSASQPSRTWR